MSSSPSLLTRTVHFIVSAASLLSGDLDECLTPLDPSCEGGVASVAAWARNLTPSNNNINDPTLVLPFIDRSSPFVQMHPLGWAVNRLVLEYIMNWRVYATSPALLTSHKDDYEISSRDLTDLQTNDLPFLLSNVAIPPSNSWAPYTHPVFFDDETGLAVLSIVNDNQPMNHPQIESTLGLLDYIELVNARGGCGNHTSLLEDYLSNSGVPTIDGDNNNNDELSSPPRCWLPVIVYADVRDSFLEWLDPVVNHLHPPALIANGEESIPGLERPSQMANGVWVVSHEMDQGVYTQLSLTIAPGGRSLTNVEFLERDMKDLPEEAKDATYVAHQEALQALAREAATTDPIVGQSLAVPVQRVGSYRRCKGGECEVGNLFNDAIRWYEGTDISFQNAGGFRGPGWPAGDVRVSDIWAALPFDNTICTGVISGVSLFKLFNYSITWSTFEGENTDLGGRLLQVSGLRISYNLGLPNTTRIVAMEYWDKTQQSYQPVERLGLYSFATTSYMCSGFAEYPRLLGPETLVLPGEVPVENSDGMIIQAIVADYLLQLGEVYNPGQPEERLVNRTDLLEPLNFVQTADSCVPGEYWQVEISTCAPCPGQTPTTFLRTELTFDGDSGDQTIQLVNAALHDVAILVKTLPPWVLIRSAILASGEEINLASETVQVPSGVTVDITFAVDMDSLEPGTAQGTVSMGVLDGGQYPGCTGRDATFDILARKYPEDDLNQLGPLLFVGWGLAGVVVLAAIGLVYWVVKYRHIQTVRTLQPIFLVTIALGVLVMSLSLIPLGIDDGFASQKWCDISCMSVPWLLSLGFTGAMSALFSKLWRIHRLFRATYRRVQLKAKDVMTPFAVLFTLNFAALFVWTLVSPLRFQRLPINEDEPYNTYGTCESNKETFGTSMAAVVVSINAVSLLFASYTAYLARDIGDEFAESKSVGLALFCWVQLFCIAGPMLFLIDADNVAAKYFLQAGVIFAVCISMLCFIFAPIVWQKNQAAATLSAQRGEAGSRVSSGSAGTPKTSKYSLRDGRGVHVSGVNRQNGRSSNVSQRSASIVSHDKRDMQSLEEDVSNGSSSKAPPESSPIRTASHVARSVPYSLDTVSESEETPRSSDMPSTPDEQQRDEDEIVRELRQRLRQRLENRRPGGGDSRNSEELATNISSSLESNDNGASVPAKTPTLDENKTSSLKGDLEEASTAPGNDAPLDSMMFV